MGHALRDPREVVVLGSGQDGGVPQIGFDPDPPLGRTASSVAVTDGEIWVLLDASPDLRAQQRRLLTHDRYAARRRSLPPFDAVCLTHGHMGHYVGLVHLGKEAADVYRVPLVATEAMTAFLSSNEPWATLLRGHLTPRLATPGTGLALTPSLQVTAVAVPHRAEHTDTVGWSIDLDGWRVLYLPDIDGWDAWPEAAPTIAAHDVALLDATFYDDREQLARDLTPIPHPRVVDTVQRFGELAGATRIVLTHVNRTNPLNDPDSPEWEMVHDAGFEVAVDGMTLQPR